MGRKKKSKTRKFKSEANKPVVVYRPTSVRKSAQQAIDGYQANVRERKAQEDRTRKNLIAAAKKEEKRKNKIQNSKLRKLNARHDFTKSAYQRAYEDYLTTDWWKKRRRNLKEQFGYSCEICSSEEKLEVHHNNYSSLCEETNDDLTVLCHDCHSYFHETGHLCPNPVDPILSHRCCLCANEAALCVDGKYRLKFCRICLSNFLRGRRFPIEYNFNRRFEHTWEKRTYAITKKTNRTNHLVS